MRQDCRTANANIISFYTYNACVPVDTFLSTVVSKTVPLLQNKQLNYKQNDIRLAKFRENIRQTLQKNVLLGSPNKLRQICRRNCSPSRFLYFSAKFRNGEGFCNKRNIRHVKQNCCRQAVALKKTPAQNRVVTCVEFERFCKTGTFCKRLTVQAKFHMTK